MAVRRRDFARQNGLKSAEQALRNARLAGQAGILEDQHATFRLLRRDQRAGFHQERPYIFVAPTRRQRAMFGLGSDEAVQDPPERREIMGSVEAVKFEPPFLGLASDGYD